MNSVPKVSVIVPVYNVEKYLQTCIDSLLQQSLQEIELIFVNDASPDHSLEILHRNEAAHPDKMRVISLKKNMRQGGARNVGMRIARADYIGFVDSDDFVSPYMYEKMYEKAKFGNFDAVFVETDTVPDNATLLTMEKQKFSCFSKKQLSFSDKRLSDDDRNSLIISNLGGGVCWTVEKGFHTEK